MRLVGRSSWRSLAIRCCVALGAVLAGLSAAQAQRPFNKPDEAASALAEAVRSGERGRMLAILGRHGDDIISSGDAVADDANRQRFLTAYDARHRLETKGRQATLLVGADDFPFPIPIVRRGSRWRFDAKAGRQEILYRRIGRNELDAIQVSLAYVDAQRDYAEKDRTGLGAGVFAQRIVSRPGTKDGLYWPPSQPGDESPLGQLAAQAAAEGYRPGGTPMPYHGYIYKVLTKQGPSAPGGAINYIADGKMQRGFALLAYPADYGNSGVMSFMVNQIGAVFQKDLGPRTNRIAQRITSFNPDKSWKTVAPSSQATTQ